MNIAQTVLIQQLLKEKVTLEAQLFNTKDENVAKQFQNRLYVVMDKLERIAIEVGHCIVPTYHGVSNPPIGG